MKNSRNLVIKDDEFSDHVDDPSSKVIATSFVNDPEFSRFGESIENNTEKGSEKVQAFLLVIEGDDKGRFFLFLMLMLL